MGLATLPTPGRLELRNRGRPYSTANHLRGFIKWTWRDGAFYGASTGICSERFALCHCGGSYADSEWLAVQASGRPRP